MSYWVHLECAHCGGTLEADAHQEGGVVSFGDGSGEACMSVTWNYTPLFAEALGYRDDPAVENFRAYLDGKRAGDVLPALERAVAALGDAPEPGDYWAATPGNAGHALAVLAGWARQHPDGVFAVH